MTTAPLPDESLAPPEPTVGPAVTALHGVTWGVACLVAVTGLAILAAQLPERVRLLGLYLPAIGALSGGLCRWLASRFEQPWSKWRTLITILFVALSLLLTTGLAQRRHLQMELAAQPALQLSAAEQARVWRELRQHPEFGLSLYSRQRYLQYRVSRLGRWPTPWPELFWGAEVLLGTLLGGWLASRVAKG